MDLTSVFSSAKNSIESGYNDFMAGFNKTATQIEGIVDSTLGGAKQIIDSTVANSQKVLDATGSTAQNTANGWDWLLKWLPLILIIVALAALLFFAKH